MARIALVLGEIVSASDAPSVDRGRLGLPGRTGGSAAAAVGQAASPRSGQSYRRMSKRRGRRRAKTQRATRVRMPIPAFNFCPLSKSQSHMAVMLTK